MSAAASDGAKTTKKSDWARVNVAAFLFNFVVVAAGRLSFLGENNRVVSNAHPTLVTPAGWAMKIWIVIFLLELAFIVWQACSVRGRSDAITKGVGPWFAAACVSQAAWNLAFAQELILLSAVLLPLVAASLTIAFVRLAPYRGGGALAVLSPEYWLLHFPVGLHAGWSTAASLVVLNMTLEAQPLSTRVAALIISIVFASLSATFAAFAFRGEAYACAIAWAMAAIADKGEFRHETLSAAVADGVGRAFSVLSSTLVVLGAALSIAGLFYYEARVSSEGAVSGGRDGGVVGGGGGGEGQAAATAAAAAAHKKGQ